MDGADVSAPIFSLTLGKNDQSSLGLNFGNPDADDERLDPVVFRLIAGSGPVHLVGVQMSETISDVGELLSVIVLGTHIFKVRVTVITKSVVRLKYS